MEKNFLERKMYNNYKPQNSRCQETEIWTWQGQRDKTTVYADNSVQVKIKYT